MRNIRGLKAREEPQRVQTWFQSRFTGYDTAGLLRASVSLRSDSREEENYLFTEVGEENRADTEEDEMISNEELGVACRSQRRGSASTRGSVQGEKSVWRPKHFRDLAYGVLSGEIWPAKVPH